MPESSKTIINDNIGGGSVVEIRGAKNADNSVFEGRKPPSRRVKRKVTWARTTRASRSDSLIQQSTTAESTEVSDADAGADWTPKVESPDRHLSGRRGRSATQTAVANNDQSMTANADDGGGSRRSEPAAPRYNTRRSTRDRPLPCDIEDCDMFKKRKRVILVNGVYRPVKHAEKDYRFSLTTGLEEMMRVYGVEVESSTGQVKSWRHPSATEVKDSWTQRTEKRRKLIAEANVNFMLSQDIIFPAWGNFT
eukprot:Selendium_serpulae@DN5165_c0_g1_i1.p1